MTASSALDLGASSLLLPGLRPAPLPVRSLMPAPCTQACPAGVNVKAYVSLIAERRFAEALEVVRQRCPLPGICGRICHHPCEAACIRCGVDQPLAIRALKRFVADRVGELPVPPPTPLTHDARVAVIGAGPAGLTAAYDLRLAGFPVTVFDAEAEAGGMLRYGVAEYRLPRDVLDAEIEVLVGAGIELRTGCRIGQDPSLEDLLGEGFAALLLAVGAQSGRRLGIPGEEECDQVEDALAFLRRVNGGDRPELAGSVLVVGGGSTAIEAARTAVRCGANQVQILYRRYREEVLAGDEEVEAAEAEGVELRFLLAPVEVVRSANGGLEGLRCVQVGLGAPDDSGRRRPIQIPGSETLFPADLVLAAVGQQCDLGFVPRSTRRRVSARGRLRINANTAMTRLHSVFAAGDAVTGPATVIEAIAAGHRAAESIRHFLEEGRPGIREQHPEPHAATEYGLPDAAPLPAPSLRPGLLGWSPGSEHAEVELPYEVEEAVAEARRCLRCGPCGECRICAPSCGRRHFMLRFEEDGAGAPPWTALLRAPADLTVPLDESLPTEARLLEDFDLRRAHRVDPGAGLPAALLPVRTGVDRQLCRGCGRCVDVCPFHALDLHHLDNGRRWAALDPTRCRGCNLCSAVCPTGATHSSALSPDWWGRRLQDVMASEDALGDGTAVVLACQRRAGAVESIAEQPPSAVQVVRLRCAGQVDAGMLLELYRQGARRVLVAGCAENRCRFLQGATMATAQLARARQMLRWLGSDETCLLEHWSDGRAADPLGPVVEQLARRPAAPAAASEARS